MHGSELRSTRGVLPRWSDLRKPAARTVVLTAAMIAVGCALAALCLRWAAPPAPLSLTWWELLPAVVAANELGLHLEIRGEAHTFTFSELPLVLGCLFAAPWALIIARVAGDAAFQITRRKQRGVKLAFNIAIFLLETVIVVVVTHALLGGRPPTDWVGWPLVLIAVASADLVSMGAVFRAIRWHGGTPRTAQVLIAGAATALVNVGLALLAAIVLWDNPDALVLLVVVMMMTALAYRGYANLSKRYSSVKLLYDFTRSLGASMSGEAILAHMLATARDVLRAETTEVVVFDRTTGRPAMRQRSTELGGCADLVPVDSASEGLSWTEHVRSGRAMFIPRGEASPPNAALRRELGVNDVVLAPLRVEGTVVGAMLAANRLGNLSTFDEGDCRLFETLGNHTSVALENSHLLQQLRDEAEERRHEALHDSLTGLANRTLFSQQVGTAIAAHTCSAVMLMDLDRFKEINDTLGHHTGDVLLCEVANRLLGVLPDGGTAARLGGDEFGVLPPEIASTESAEAIASRVLMALQRPFVIDEVSLAVDASIGIVIAPAHGSDAALLLQRADVAMYEAKASRSGTALYCADRDTYSPRRLRLAGELGQAIQDGHVIVYFQPQAGLADQRVVGAEALVRWRHPDLGLLTPVEFIPMAEQTGLISSLSKHVLGAALRQCSRWREEGHDMGVAVNLAVRSLIDADLLRTIDDLLRETAVPPDYLTLEITESTIMADPPRTIGVLEQLAATGVRLSVDDFGTGYSSLTYLQRLPVDEVKIDKSFVFHVATDPADATIVQSIVELGHNLGLSVVAEGVEDQLAWNLLRDMHCDVAQGYLLSHPIPASAMSRWLAQYQARLVVSQEVPCDTGSWLPEPAVAPSGGQGRSALYVLQE